MPQLFDERLRLRLRFDEDPEDEREDPDFEDAALEEPDLEDAVIVVRVAEQLLLDAFERALGLGLRATGGDRLHQLREAFGLVVGLDVEAVDRLGEAQISVDTGVSLVGIELLTID